MGNCGTDDSNDGDEEEDTVDDETDGNNPTTIAAFQAPLSRANRVLSRVYW